MNRHAGLDNGGILMEFLSLQSDVSDHKTDWQWPMVICPDNPDMYSRPHYSDGELLACNLHD